MEDTQWRDKVSAWDKAYKRKRATIAWVIVLLLLLGAAVVFFYPNITKLYAQFQAYDEAFAYLEAEQYEQAADAFWRAGNVLDAPRYSGKLNYERAEAYLDCGRITYAAITFAKAGDYQDAPQRSKQLWDRFADRTVRCANSSGVVGWISPDSYAHTNTSDNPEYYEYPGNITSWSNLVSLSVNNGISVGTFRDGTVRYITLFKSNEYQYYDTEWTDIITAIYTHWHVVGLKSDGTVCVECFDNNRNCTMAQTVSQWTDIISICGNEYLVGLKADGTLSFATCDSLGRQQADFSNLSALRDVVGIRMQNYGENLTVLQADGTLHTTGSADPQPFDTLTQPMHYDVSAWFPLDMEAMEEPDREWAVIAASFPDLSGKYYQDALHFEEISELAQAAIAYGKAGNYEDARQKSMALWAQVANRQTIATQGSVVAALKADGTVALVDPGKALGKKPANLNKQYVALTFCNQDLLGITQQGDVLVIGKGSETLPATKNVVDAVYSDIYGVVMLLSDGTVVSSRNALPIWSDVVQISLCDRKIIVRTSDNIVRDSYDALNFGEYVEEDIVYEEEVVPPTYLIDLASPSNMDVFGLTAEGELKRQNHYNDYTDISQWTSLADITSGGEFLYGIKTDGSVLVTANTPLDGDDFGFDAAKWTNIVSVSGGKQGVVGLTTEGKLVFIGKKGLKNLSKIEKEVKKLSGLMIPEQ